MEVTPRRERRRHSRLAVGTAAIVLALIALASPRGPGAHGIVLDSSPKHRETVGAPKELVIRFNSRLEKSLCSVTLMSARDRRVVALPPPANAPPDTLSYGLPPLEPGAYRAHWKVLAADGHVTEGVQRFQVTAAE